MTLLPSKYTLVTLLVAAATIHCSALPDPHTGSVLERRLSDSIGNDKANSGLEDSVRIDNSNRAATLPVAQDVFAELTKGALYSNAAYCSAGAIQSLSCGATCKALGNITVAFTGREDKVAPCTWGFHLSRSHSYLYFLKPDYIAYDHSIQSVVVATRGTSDIMSLLTDAHFLQDPLNLANFPSAPPTAKVHEGIQKTFE